MARKLFKIKEKEHLLTPSEQRVAQRTSKNIILCGLCIGIFLRALCVKLHLDLILISFSIPHAPNRKPAQPSVSMAAEV
jgi:tetrahydromethanopterin S-methyltransferase subunit G